MEKFPTKFIDILKKYKYLFDLQTFIIDGRNQTIFKILNEKGLKKIMESYWRTNNIQSFTRQLNYYGFYKFKKKRPKEYIKYAEYYFNVQEFNINDVSTYYNISCKRYTPENNLNLKRKHIPIRNARRIKLKMMNENLFSKSKNIGDEKLYEDDNSDEVSYEDNNSDEVSNEDDNSDEVSYEDNESDEHDKSDDNEYEKLDCNEELSVISNEDISYIYNDNFTNYFEYDEEISCSKIEVLLNENNNLTFKFIDVAKDELIDYSRISLDNDLDVHSFNRDAIERNKCDKSFSFLEDDIATYLNGSNYYEKKKINKYY